MQKLQFSKSQRRFWTTSQHWFQNSFRNHDRTIRLVLNWANIFYIMQKQYCIVSSGIVWYCMVLCRSVLYCIVLYQMLLYCIRGYCMALQGTVCYLYSIVWYCILVYYVALLFFKLHCLLISCIAWNCRVMYCVVLCCTV